MERFKPGGDFGAAYKTKIWVCTDSPPRNFEQCNAQEAQVVWRECVNQVMANGLGKDTVVFRSGCMMGCKGDGTAVAIACGNTASEGAEQVMFFRGVKVADVKNLVQSLPAEKKA